MRCQSVLRACGGVLESDSGNLSYPVDNGTYNHNARCAWLIKTNHTKILNITFTKFNLENPMQNKECKYDWLQVSNFECSMIVSYYSCFKFIRSMMAKLPLRTTLVDSAAAHYRREAASHLPTILCIFGSDLTTAPPLMDLNCIGTV